ncbi:uncharacterized protein PSFLO_04424 [Pseudozyma flocculosa]|uniref:C2H2-type domain-containing protein n=1 Tax=Pseudozyma flocculosa TaxID=84751 RepID=A0A5C3F4T9_9BASI|nr:uncharacterized protein PSFLO_04424 [Pseudozyma flocculosa]
MDVDVGDATPTKRPADNASLPSIKNLFGIERADNLRNMRRAPSQDDIFNPASPPSSARPAFGTRPERGPYAHGGSGSSFSSLSGGSGPTLGPIRTRQSSTSGSLGRTGTFGTPPRQTVLPQMLSSEESGRRRTESRTRQSLKGLLMSPPGRKAFLEGEGPGDHANTPRRHRPGSSSGSAPISQLLPGPEHITRASPGHAATLSDPSPSLLPGYAPSGHTSAASSNTDAWGGASTQSGSTSPRTSWHSRSSTLESGDPAYKMMMGDGPRERQPSLLPPFREPGQAATDLLRRSPEQTITSLTRHGSLRNPQMPSEGSAHLEAASELLRMGRGGAQPSLPVQTGGRTYHHKHSASMQERAPLPLDLYTSEQIDTRGHRPKSSSMSLRGPPPLAPAGPYPQGLQLEQQPPAAAGNFDSFHSRRGRGAADEATRPGANFVFPRRPMPDPVEAQRYQAHVMRGPGLASVPDGIVSGTAGTGGSPRSSATGTIASGQAKYECAWCGKRFSRPSSLKIHHHSHQKCHGPGGEGGEQSGRSHISHSASSSRTDDPEMWHHPSFGSLQQITDHPPLSRSAFEPGSRSMGSWADMQQQQHFRQQPLHGHGGPGLEPPFMQLRERRLSESSGEEDDEDEAGDRKRSGIMLVKDSPKQDTASSHLGPPSILSSDDEDRPPTSRMRSGTSGSTAGIRVGFSSLLNPKAKAEATFDGGE